MCDELKLLWDHGIVVNGVKWKFSGKLQLSMVSGMVKDMSPLQRLWVVVVIMAVKLVILKVFGLVKL
jgi:hypothetical protein